AAVTHSPAASGGSPPSRPAPALSGRLAYPDQESHRESFPYKNRLTPPQQAFSSIDGIEVYIISQGTGRRCLLTDGAHQVPLCFSAPDSAILRSSATIETKKRLPILIVGSSPRRAAS